MADYFDLGTYARDMAGSGDPAALPVIDVGPLAGLGKVSKVFPQLHRDVLD